MNALQKVAWIEVIVAIVASIAVLGAMPLLGDRSTDLYVLLAVVPAIYPFLMRPRGGEIVKDERDNEIKKRSEYWGVSTAWMFFVISMIAISMWHNTQDVPTKYLFALIWIQFAVYIGAKGAAALAFYRRVSRAA